MSSLMGETFESTVELMSEMTKLTKFLTNHGNFGDELVERANGVIGEMEKFIVLFKKDCILFDDVCTNSQVDNMELQDELVVVKKERDELKEDVVKARECAKGLEEKLGKDCEDSGMVYELNVKVTKLNDLVMEKDEMLNGFRERLKCMETEVAQKEREVNDLKHQNEAAYKSMLERLRKQLVLESDKMLNGWKEKLRLLQVKVLQKEEEVLDFKEREMVAYQTNVENLKNQVLEKDQMLNECNERLRLVEEKVLQREQEVNDLNHRNAAGYKIMEERLKNHDLECVQLLSMCKGKYKCMEDKVLRLEQELRDLKHQQLATYQVQEEKLKNQVLERDQMLNGCEEKLRLLELKVVEKEQEVHDLNHQNAVAYKSMEERLKTHALESDQLLSTCKERLEFMEAEVLQLEKELHDLKHQKLVAYQMNEEKLKNQVMERDQMLNVCEEKLKSMEMKVAQKDQELHESNHQKLAAYQISEEKLKNQGQMLNVCEEKLKSMEMRVAQKEQELHDLKNQKLAASQISEEKLINRDQMLNACEEKLKAMEVKVVQKEQELHDLKNQKLAASQINEEKLKNQELERDNLLSTCDEKLKILEVKVVEKKQEVDDLNHQKSAAYEVIKKLTHTQKKANQREKELRRQNVEAYENAEKLRQLLSAVERVKLPDEELKDIKEKLLEADKNLEELRRKNYVNSPVPKGSRKSRRMWTGKNEGSANDDYIVDQAGSFSHSSPHVETSSRADLENRTGKSHYSGCRNLFAMPTRINEGGGKGDVSADQAVLQIPNSSPRVEAHSTGIEKETDRSQGSASVQVAYREGIARFGELDSDLAAATAKGKISELPSLKPSLTLVAFSLRSRKRRLTVNAFEDVGNTSQKKEQTHKLSHETGESSISLLSSMTPNPVLRSCKEKVVSASDSQIEIINVDSSSDEDP